jgi:IMP cyclohydrolase
MDLLQERADVNLMMLGITYPGPGIVIGLSEDGKTLIQVCWIMGQDDNGQNRVFVKNADGDLHTAAADPSEVTDHSPIVYRAMAEEGSLFVVTNGAQTESIIRSLRSFGGALGEYQYKPDDPNFTPRISAQIILKTGGTYSVQMSVLRRSPFDDECERSLFSFESLPPGFGHLISTYSGDGDPLPPFTGGPLLLPVIGDTAEQIGAFFRDNLVPDNFVSLAVKTIDVITGESLIHIINRHRQVGT